MQNYSDEEVKDITEREKKGLELLKQLQLTPAAIIQKVNMGNDVFADKLIPFLQDFKYNKDSVVSPVQQKDLKDSDAPTEKAA